MSYFDVHFFPTEVANMFSVAVFTYAVSVYRVFNSSTGIFQLSLVSDRLLFKKMGSYENLMDLIFLRRFGSFSSTRKQLQQFLC